MTERKGAGGGGGGDTNVSEDSTGNAPQYGSAETSSNSSHMSSS